MVVHLLEGGFGFRILPTWVCVILVRYCIVKVKGEFGVDIYPRTAQIECKREGRHAKLARRSIGTLLGFQVSANSRSTTSPHRLLKGIRPLVVSVPDERSGSAECKNLRTLPLRKSLSYPGLRVYCTAPSNSFHGIQMRWREGDMHMHIAPDSQEVDSSRRSNTQVHYS